MTDPGPTPTDMTKPVMPILAAERMKGYREGVSTINQVVRDEAAYEARIAALAEGSIERRRWGFFCFLCGIALAALLHKMVMAA